MTEIRMFNIWHHKLFAELLSDVPIHERKHIVLYGVNDKYTKDPIPVEGFTEVMEYDLPKYEAQWQERNYCQSSCLYHVYTHPELIDGYDYIGFGQYDMKYGQHLLPFVREHCTPTTVFHSLTIPLIHVLRQCPEIVTHALPHYCKFFGIENLDLAPYITHNIEVPMLHTFIMHKTLFSKMMSWLTEYMRLIEENYPSQMSQCEFLERLHGVFLMLNADRFIRVEPHLEHIWPLYHEKTEFIAYKTKV